MVTECPHCFRRVVPHANGDCPACHRDINAPPAGDSARSRITINENTRFPDICCICGTPTSRCSKLVCSGQIAIGAPGTKTSSDPGFLTVALFGGIFARLALLCFGFGPREQGHMSDGMLIFRIPHCKVCSKAGKLEAATTDLEHYQIALIVHRDFAMQLPNAQPARR